METAKYRNITLDYFKIILAILVILCHMSYDNNAALLFGVKYGIARIAVPCFFIINGFYLANFIQDRQKMKKYLIKFLRLYAVWMTIYFGFYTDYRVFDDNRFLDFLFLFFRGFYHLWYVAALILAVILLWLLHKVRVKIVLTLGIIIFLVGCLISWSPYIDPLSDLAFSLLDFKVLELCIHNFLFIGFPFLTLGYCIKKYETKWNSLNKSTIYILILFSLFAFGTEMFVMRHLMIVYDFYINLPVYLSFILICPLLFIYVLTVGTYRLSDDTVSKLSSGIYFIHPLILSVIGEPFRNYSFLMLIFFLSLLLSFCLIEVNKKSKIFL